MESLTRHFLHSQRERRVVLFFMLHHAKTFSFRFIYFSAIVQIFNIIVETLTRFHLSQHMIVGGLSLLHLWRRWIYTFQCVKTDEAPLRFFALLRITVKIAKNHILKSIRSIAERPIGLRRIIGHLCMHYVPLPGLDETSYVSLQFLGMKRFWNVTTAYRSLMQAR